MTSVKNMKELEAVLKKRIAAAHQNRTAPVVRKVMKEEIEKEVYDVYPNPIEYERKKDSGGLTDDKNIKVSLIDNGMTLVVENIREDEGRNVAQIVETGQGYTYDFEYNDVPRPFTEATREHLRDTGVHKYALYKELKKQGLNVEVK